jgi:ElaB/YqjD/DUF883 family membrane-anchored ribosome-binding protein
MAEEPIKVNANRETGIERTAFDEGISAASSEADHVDHPEAIKDQIEETRERLGETIDAIQEKLSFANVSEQVSEHVSSALESAKDTIYDATIGKAATFIRNTGDGISQSKAVKIMQKNPFPLVLIGLGAGLLVYQNLGRGSSSRMKKFRYRESERGNGEDFSDSATNFERSSEQGGKTSALESVNRAAGSAYESVNRAAGSAYESVSDSVSGAVSTAYSTAGNLAHKAYDSAGEMKTRAYDKYDQYVEENPLALGALAVAVGAAVGMAIPSTDYEGRFMGEAKENMLQKAQDVASDYLDQAKEATENLVDNSASRSV